MGKTLSDHSQTINIIHSELTRVLGLTGYRQLVAGHVGTPLYVCEQDSQLKIIKIGLEGQSREEVDRNIEGYNKIAEIGASSILPPGLDVRKIEDIPVLVMNFLGKNYAERTRAGDVKLHRDFITFIPQIYEKSLQTNSEAHKTSLEDWQKFLYYWYKKLAKNGKITSEDVEMVNKIPIDKMSGSTSSLCLADFTPDNIFVTQNKISFIDPWNQNTFLGSPIMGLEQFKTLSSEIYKLPGFKEVEVDFEDMLNKVGKSLGLNPKQILMQKRMGSILQYALSGFVRIENNSTTSQRYIDKSRELLSSLIRK